MARRLFGEDEDKRIEMAYLAGESSMVIATRYGCDKSAVLGSLRRRGVALRDSGKAKRVELDRRRDEIVALYKSGLSVWAIKRRLVCAHGNPINRILREAGIAVERRPVVGANHHNWKGGHHLDQSGYRRVKLRKSDPFYGMCAPNGYVMEHRLVLARALGRLLRSHETVHHIDGDRQNNALENLELRQGKHGAGVRLVCRSCGSHDVEAVKLTAGES